MALVFALLAGIAIFSWGGSLEDQRTFRSFAIPTVTMIALSSTVGQVAARHGKKKERRWLFISSQRECAEIRKALESSDETCSQRHAYITEDKASSLLNRERLKGFTGIVLGEKAQLDEESVQRLLKFRSVGTQVQNLVSWSENNLQRVPPEFFNSQWLIRADGFQLDPDTWKWRLKRYGDLVVATLLLAMTFPLMIVVGILIRVEDGGPVLFRQERSGIYGQSFIMTKFRSMRVDAEQDGAQWARWKDSRVTRVGAVIRRLRIDELPQLINVINGEMSLIGPRPERPEIEKVLEKEIAHYRVRHWIRPGLSGWAQVCYPYGASIEDSHMKLSYDIYYIRNAGFFIDLLILLKTIRMVTAGKNSSPHKKSESQGSSHA